MIALDKNGRFYLQETVQRKRKYDILEMLESVPLKIFLFDVLLLDGSNVMNEANETRRKLLRALLFLETQ